MTEDKFKTALKRLLDEKGITIYALSKITGKRHEHIRRVLNDKGRLKVGLLLEIMEIAKITFEEIMDEAK